MPVKPLHDDGDIDDLKREAEDLLKARQLCDRQTAQRIREFHPAFVKASDEEIHGLLLVRRMPS